MGMYFDVKTKHYEFSAKNVTEILTYLPKHNQGKCTELWFHDNDYYVNKKDIENMLSDIWAEEDAWFYLGRLSGILEMLRDTIDWEKEKTIILGLN